LCIVRAALRGAFMKSICILLALAACGPGARDPGTGDDDDTGPDGGSTVEERQCNKMDLVFVVDDSGSMDLEQANLGSNFPMFASVLQNFVNADGEHIDFRIAVTTTGKDISYTIQGFGMSEDGDNGAFRNNCGSTSRFIESTDPNMNTLLPCRANVGTGGPSYEMPLLMSKWALSDRVADNTNAGFLRDDALLGLVYLTDENDVSTVTNNWTLSISNPDPVPDWHPQDQVQFLDGLKGHRSRWAAGVIAGDGNCSSSFGEAADAARLKEFVNLANQGGSTQATFSSICSGDLSGALQQMLTLFQGACGEIIL
jgi:hypothetical protein